MIQACLPSLSLSYLFQIQLWPPHNAMLEASFMLQVIQSQNLSHEGIPVRGIMFKFCKAGSSDDGGEICLERLDNLFSICDATCELSWVLLVGEQIVAFRLPFLWVS